MDFSIIEGLTDQEINELYNDIEINNYDTQYISICSCTVGTTGFLRFGNHMWYVFDYCSSASYFSHRGCDYCNLQIKDKNSCENWCVSHNFTLHYFDNICKCTETGKVAHNTWANCSR